MLLFWRYFRGNPTDWICKLKRGTPSASGLGLSFYYTPDYTTVVSVPTGIVSTEFHFEERTADYQIVHVQGILTWRISKPEDASRLLDFSVDPQNRYLSEDPRKMQEKLQNLVAVLGRRVLKKSSLQEALTAADTLGDELRANFSNEEYVATVGVEIISVEILSIKPEPDVGRALEASTREEILKESDDATAKRRLAALENERTINDREVGNELAKEKAARAVSETREQHEKMEQSHQLSLASERQQAELEIRKREADAAQREQVDKARSEAERESVRIAGELELVVKEQDLAEGRLAVSLKEAEAEKAKLQVVYGALNQLSADQLESLALMGGSPGTTIAQAFRKLAEHANSIGHLNITPDLLRTLLDQPGSTASDDVL